jgi:DNA-binding CsgD family transcriptional regulator
MSNILSFPSPRPSANRTTPLSDREREVLSYAYLTVEDTALALGCAPSTVKAHRRSINKRLGTSNITEAVMLVGERLAA